MRLENKVALVTGGAAGVGRASAVLFGREGASVVVADLNEEHARETVEQINAAGGESTVAGGDVTASEDAQRMVQAAVETYGKLDILVNSAGITSRTTGEDPNSEAVWDRVIDVNLKGTYMVSRWAVPEMDRAGGGSIINIASIIGLVGHRADIPGVGSPFNPYPASKGGVIQFTRNLAVHKAKDNIRVNCICPGYLWTSLTESLTSDPEVLEILEKHHPMGRLGRPEEVAYAALYLASDESSFVTGIPLAVDGGYTAQ
jgi:NAD(P)-dependent dehydrogenase (short-subunit alcohol dehydrogenase family)